jgi:hypothetical protein
MVALLPARLLFLMATGLQSVFKALEDGVALVRARMGKPTKWEIILTPVTALLALVALQAHATGMKDRGRSER